MTRTRNGTSITDVSQILAILFIGFIFSVIAHKGYAGISLLAQKHCGTGFWPPSPLLLANIAGG